MDKSKNSEQKIILKNKNNNNQHIHENESQNEEKIMK